MKQIWYFKVSFFNFNFLIFLLSQKFKIEDSEPKSVLNPKQKGDIFLILIFQFQLLTVIL